MKSNQIKFLKIKLSNFLPEKNPKLIFLKYIFIYISCPVIFPQLSMHSLLIKVVSFSWHFLQCSCNLLIQLTLPNWSSYDTKSGFCSYTPWFWGDFNQLRISLSPKKRILSKRVRLFVDFKMPFKPKKR